jgi:hypothetical protein
MDVTGTLTGGSLTLAVTTLALAGYRAGWLRSPPAGRGVRLADLYLRLGHGAGHAWHPTARERGRGGASGGVGCAGRGGGLSARCSAGACESGSR